MKVTAHYINSLKLKLFDTYAMAECIKCGNKWYVTGHSDTLGNNDLPFEVDSPKDKICDCCDGEALLGDGT